MTPISANSIKGFLSLLAIPALVYAAAIIKPNGGVQVVFWLAGAGFLVSCFIHLGRLLGERGQGWAFLLPGCLILLVGGFITCFGMFLISGVSGSNDPTAVIAFGIAFSIIIFGIALKYNADGLGIFDAIIITLIQVLFSLLIVGLVIMLNTILGNRRRR